MLFHLAQRIVALGKLTQEESLLGPLLRDAVSPGGEASGDMKDRVRRVAPTLSLSKQELRWLAKTGQGKWLAAVAMIMAVRLLLLLTMIVVVVGAAKERKKRKTRKCESVIVVHYSDSWS